jgi:hypothetical protein
VGLEIPDRMLQLLIYQKKKRVPKDPNENKSKTGAVSHILWLEKLCNLEQFLAAPSGFLQPAPASHLDSVQSACKCHGARDVPSQSPPLAMPC